MDEQFIIVMVTTPSEEVGEEIASALVEKKLAACVNMISPIFSLYSWEGKINRDQEVLLIVKSRADLFEKDLIPAVQSVHPYEVPEIIALPIIKGSADYLDWMKQVTQSG
jgi:periplasmic divalent cation tolerance protein